MLEGSLTGAAGAVVPWCTSFHWLRERHLLQTGFRPDRVARITTTGAESDLGAPFENCALDLQELACP